MKRSTSIAFTAAIGLFLVTGGISAETVLATFEKTDEPISEVVYCQQNSWVLFNGIVDNNVKDEIMNKTNKCYMVQLDKNYDWWGNFLDFHLSNPINITQDSRYMHILHYRSVINDTWWVCLNTDWALDDADKGKLRFDGNNNKAGDWEDIVVDMKYLIDNNIPLSKFDFAVSNDWSGPKDNPGGLYYFDEIVLNSNPLPRGINILPDTTMSLFLGNDASYAKWVSKLDLQNSENSSAIVANPFTTQMTTLNSPKIMQFNKSANAAWWQGPRFVFPGIYQVGRNSQSSYLHVMLNIPEMEAGKDYYTVQLVAKDFSGKEVNSSDMNKYWADDKGKWCDYVLDVTSLGYVAEVQVRFDIRKDVNDAYINSPAGTFYLDAFTINNNENPRTQVIQNVTSPSRENVKVYTTGNSIYVKGNVSGVKVYNMIGQLVTSRGANTNLTTISVAKGVYFVKSVLSDGTTSNNKILVQ